jgi:hypothetical protein
VADADPALLARLLSEEGVVTDAGEPGRLAWIGAVLGHRWHHLLDGVRFDDTWGLWAMGTLVVVGLGVVGLFVWILTRGLVGAAKRADAVVVGARPAASGLDRAMAEALLAAGRRREAAGLAWLWLVEGLGGAGIGEPHPDQTHGDFVGTVDRRNPGWALRDGLVDLRRAADHLCYAPEEPTVDAVVAWFDAVGGLRTRAGVEPPVEPRS